MNNQTKVLKAVCKERGTLILGVDYPVNNEGFSISGNLGDWSFSNAKSLYEIGRGFTKINRFGKTIIGGSYTLKMAENDFKNHAKWQFTLAEIAETTLKNLCLAYQQELIQSGSCSRCALFFVLLDSAQKTKVNAELWNVMIIPSCQLGKDEHFLRTALAMKKEAAKKGVEVSQVSEMLSRSGYSFEELHRIERAFDKEVVGSSLSLRALPKMDISAYLKVKELYRKKMHNVFREIQIIHKAPDEFIQPYLDRIDEMTAKQIDYNKRVYGSEK